MKGVNVMKHSSINAFFVLIIFHATSVPLYGMLLRRISPSRPSTSKLPFYGTTRLNPRTFSSKPDSSTPASDKKTQTPQKLPQNPSSTTFFGQFKNRAQQFTYRTRQWLQEWLSKGKSYIQQKIVGKDVQDIIEKIKNDPLNAIDTFDTFIVKNNQDTVDELLDNLIIYGENDKQDEIEFLEFLEVAITRYVLYPKIDTYIIIGKIVNWASSERVAISPARVIDLVTKSTTTHSLVIDLITLDSSKKLASKIAEKYEFI